jgi:hypothetical protein
MPSENSTSEDLSNADHLVVLIHGLWGLPIHLNHLRERLAQEHADKGNLHILVPKSNSENNTYDGIDVCGERVAHEIEICLKELELAGSKVTKISVVGYSLGGLIARYVVGLLYTNGFFETLRPINFTTFATPHLGVRTPKLGYRAQTWNYLGSRTLSTSGQQMFLADNFRGTGRPLLSLLADPNSIFLRGLKMFARRSIYANTVNDRSVPFYTSAISRTDPYVDLEAVEVHPLPDQEMPVVLHPERPVSPRKRRASEKKEPITMRQRVAWARESLPFYAFLFCFVPLAVPLFMVNAGYQTYKSAQRVKLHEQGKGPAKIDLKRYRTLPLLEESQAVQDRLVSHLAATSSELKGGEDYLPTPPPEPSSTSSTSDLKTSSEEESLAKDQEAKNDSPWPTLALTREQFEMIEHLDGHVGFTKYPVHIQKVRHTHAAIVVRTPKESFAEGKCVIGHWAKGFVG